VFFRVFVFSPGCVLGGVCRHLVRISFFFESRYRLLNVESWFSLTYVVSIEPLAGGPPFLENIFFSFPCIDQRSTSLCYS